MDGVHTLQQPILDAGSTIDNDAIAEAVALTLGYPYMIQLVGFQAWQMRENLSDPISLSNVQAGAISISSKGRVRFLHHALRSQAEMATHQE